MGNGFFCIIYALRHFYYNPRMLLPLLALFEVNITLTLSVSTDAKSGDS